MTKRSKLSTLKTGVKLSGRLTVRDFQEMQGLAGSSLEHSGQFRVLVELDDFQGWSNENGWENTSFEFFPQDQLEEAQAWLAQ